VLLNVRDVPGAIVKGLVTSKSLFMDTDPHCRETAVDRSWLAYDPLQFNYWTGLPTFRWEYSRVRSPFTTDRVAKRAKRQSSKGRPNVGSTYLAVAKKS